MSTSPDSASQPPAHGATDPEDELDTPTLVRPVRIMATVFAALVALVMVAIMMITAYDVIRRKLGMAGFEGSVERSEVLLAVIAVGGLVVAEVDGMHVRSPILTDHLPRRLARAVIVLALLISAVVVGWVAYQAFQVGWNSFERREFRYGITQVPIWPGKLFVPFALAAFAIALLAKAVAVARRPVRPKSAEETVIDTLGSETL